MKIQTLEQLKSLATSTEGIECYIALNGGGRSSKHIWFDTNKFEVLNEIDNTEQKLTEKQIMSCKYTNIGVAIRQGALFTYEN